MDQKPILYSCSGCSLAGQTAHTLALHLNKIGIVEMSCLAGLASGKKSFKSKALNREIWIIDGCQMQCAKTILQNKDMQETKHIKLYEHGIKKHQEPEIPIDFDKLAEAVTKNT